MSENINIVWLKNSSNEKIAPITTASQVMTYDGSGDLKTKLEEIDSTFDSLIGYVDGKFDELDIPSALSELKDDSSHRTVTDEEKETWNNKSDFDGNYNSLSNKPSIPDAYDKTEIDGMLDPINQFMTAKEDAQPNIIEEITVNGHTLTPSNKSVNITVPIDYLTANDITGKANSADVYTKTIIDQKVDAINNGKANKANSLSGYGITDAYTKDEIDSNIDSRIEALNRVIHSKADSEHAHDDIYYTETEIDFKLLDIQGYIDYIINGSIRVPYADHSNYAEQSGYAESSEKSSKDGNDNDIVSTYETKNDSNNKLDAVYTYIGTALGTKSTATNLVNGSAEGSLRGTSTNTESDSYTIGEYAFAEGELTSASGYASHAEGSMSKTSGVAAHAEGYDTEANGDYSHAEGCSAKATADYTHVEGMHTIASGRYQHVQGKYNVEDASGNYIHIVGNGTSSSRSNAHTLDINGNAWFKGDIYVGSTSGTNKDDGSVKLVTETELNNAITAAIGNILGGSF